MPNLKFEIIHTSKKSNARVGKIHTAHGVIDTPNFVAVGTNGTMKAIQMEDVQSIGLQLMFCNTYHLMLQPGAETVKKAGGLHRFMNRSMPLITDSGGFQVFSLAYGSVHDEIKSRGQKKQDKMVLKITEEGVLFRSYRDGQKVLLTPETSIEAQKALGADIIIPFDELPPYHFSQEKLQDSFERTHRWEKRSLKAHLKDPQHQSMYAVIHGGMDFKLREQSCRELSSLPFEGFAIGGSVGKTKEELLEIVSWTRQHLPNEAPNHLLGIGDISSLEKLIPLGIDTFDSSYPTKAARHGVLLTEEGPLKIEKKMYALHFQAIEGCSCPTCKNHTLAYLHHLFKAKELNALSLASVHNLHFMVQMMEKTRQKILNDEI